MPGAQTLSSSAPRIAVVDDDHYGRTSLASLLRSCGMEAVTFDRASALLAQDVEGFTCIVSDIQMPGMTGLELARRLKARAPDLPVILLTAFPEDHGRREAERLGVARYLEKPLFSDDLLAFLRELLANPGPL